MGKIEFINSENIEQKSKNIKIPYATRENVNSRELKFLVPWAQYDEKNMVVEHFTVRNYREKPFNEQQIDKQSIENDIAIKIMLNELCERR